ncbi:MAG: (E)-4-hydroxy-3-methylbut-2-enyl-diphosphate synthase [Sphaerochaetaceae bacterium]|nr:(E)-4-hydroxy-3-methylbut-2-enyl-diphosphate synthase [Sphaerochaetaceae bacterium]
MIAKIGKIEIGENNPITVQTMYDRPVSDIEDVVKQIVSLKALGCDIMRFAYVNESERETFKQICQRSCMPLVADIHFDYKLALDAFDIGFDKVRINPGNIGAKWKSIEVFKKARDLGKCIRIGLNSGSLPRNLEHETQADLMVNTALEYLNWAEEVNFTNSVVSLKSTDCDITYDAAKKFALQSSYPQHLGVTEAGSVISSTVRGTWVLSRLLEKNIGSTIRFSINGSIESEVIAGVELLRTLGLRKKGVRIIACPRCGRYSFDSHKMLESVEYELLKSDKNVCIAFMGCQVNGPGEAKNADLAITGIGNKTFIYRKGKLYKEVEKKNAIQEFWKAFEEL